MKKNLLYMETIFFGGRSFANSESFFANFQSRFENVYLVSVDLVFLIK